MPETYTQRFDRIMHPRQASPSLIDTSPVIAAGRSSGRLRGLLSRIQMERQARAEELASQRLEAALSRQAAQEDLARQREERMASQFGQTQERLAGAEEARSRHNELMERLAVEQAGFARKKSAREEDEAVRVATERARFEPIYKALMGETVPGMAVDPDTLDATFTVNDKVHKIPGHVIGPMLEKHYGYKYKAPSGEDKSAVAEATVAINSLAAESGVKLDPTTKTALAKVVAKQPSLLDALPDELAARANWQKESDRVRKLTSVLDMTDFSKLPKDTRSWLNPASWVTDKPAVMALKGFTDKNEPNVSAMDIDEAKKAGHGLIQKRPGGYFLNEKPITAPEPLGSLLDRLQPRQTMTNAPAATATPQPVGPVQERSVRGQRVRVQRMSDGTYIEVE